MKEDCERMKDRMADHLFDGLGAQGRDALDEHVARCSKCAEHFQKLQDEKALLAEFAGKVDAGMKRRKEAVAEAIRRCDPNERISAGSGWRAISLRPFAALAAAAVLLIAVGFAAGRLMPGEPVDVEQLRAALESSLKSSLEEGIHSSLLEQVNRDRESALDRYYVRVKDELARQFHREMNGLAVQTLAVSDASMERRLEQLVRLIEAAREVDHHKVARALYHLESNRLEDRTRLGQSLESLGSIKGRKFPVVPTTN